MARVIIDESLKDKNKALVLEAFDTLFNRRDYAAAQRFWSPDYIQHSAHIEPGRDGLFNLVKRLPPTLKYEPGTIVAGGEFVIVHGRFSGFQAVSWIAADILRIKHGLFVEHWDVIRTRPPGKRQRVVCPCSATNFPTGFKGLADRSKWREEGESRMGALHPGNGSDSC